MSSRHPVRGRLPCCAAVLAIAVVLTGCNPHRTPPPNRAFDGLPVTGTLAFARKAGFTTCISDPISMRCRRPGIMFQGQGPYEAAADMIGRDGNGGFDQLILWHDEDQMAVQAVGDALEQQGWRVCFTGNERAGDQEVYTRPGVPLVVSIDISYWSKRRLRLIPLLPGRKPAC